MIASISVIVFEFVVYIYNRRVLRLFTQYHDQQTDIQKWSKQIRFINFKTNRQCMDNQFEC